MTAYWHHIYPINFITNNIKIGQFIIKFTNDFNVENLHKHNKEDYSCKEIDKGFVEGIFRVTKGLQNNNFQLLNIVAESNEIEVPKAEFESGQYFYTNSTELEEILPYNW